MSAQRIAQRTVTILRPSQKKLKAAPQVIRFASNQSLAPVLAGGIGAGVGVIVAVTVGVMVCVTVGVNVG